MEATPEDIAAPYRPNTRRIGVMIPLPSCMYPDEVAVNHVVYTNTTGSQGAPRPTFPIPGEPIPARVQSKSESRTDAQGRVYTVIVWDVVTPDDIAADTGDRIDYLGRKLNPQGRTMPRGIGNVDWLTQCQEVR